MSNTNIHPARPGLNGLSGPYPCLDEHRRYRSFPCSECRAASCWMGEKPVAAKPALHPGQRHCEHCGTPFRPTGRGRYCAESCRYQAMMRRRRRRRAAATYGGGG